MKSFEDLDKQGLEKKKFFHLTTKGRKTGNPHKVELWFAISQGKVYLSHEGDETDWMKNIAKNGAVVVEIAGFEFKGTAKVAGEGSDSRGIGTKALYEKYYSKATKEVIDDWFSLSTVIEIAPQR